MVVLRGDVQQGSVQPQQGFLTVLVRHRIIGFGNGFSSFDALGMVVGDLGGQPGCVQGAVQCGIQPAAATRMALPLPKLLYGCGSVLRSHWRNMPP